MAIYLGLLIFGYFHGCDPIALNNVDTPDQLSIVLAVEVLGELRLTTLIVKRFLGSLPGMPGLFLSTIFSATLSTLSSGLNSIVAVLWEDLLKERFNKNSNTKPEHAMKVIAIFLGVVTTVMAYTCKLLGGIFQVVVATLGATSGPVAGRILRNSSLNVCFQDYFSLACSSRLPTETEPLSDSSPLR